jgi:hypothetical protein
MLKTLYLISLSFLLLFSCKENLPEPDQKEIREIVSAVMTKICQDTFMMKSRQPRFVSDSLYRRHLIYENDVFHYNTLNYLINDKRYLDTIPFSKSDSAYLVVQEKFIEKLKLDTTLTCLTPKSHTFLSNKAHKLMEEKHCCYTGGYYTFSIPIFSYDHLTAIIYIDYQGFVIDSSYTIVYIFKKTSNSWKIVKQKTVAMA